MILIENTCISDDIEDQEFVCNLDKCKGACCVEGDSGAPLDEDELAILDEIYPEVAPYLTEAGKKVIAMEGTWTKDSDGDYVTPIINGRECAYAIYDKKVFSNAVSRKLTTMVRSATKNPFPAICTPSGLRNMSSTMRSTTIAGKYAAPRAAWASN
jgi:hypothetical protein